MSNHSIMVTTFSGVAPTTTSMLVVGDTPPKIVTILPCWLIYSNPESMVTIFGGVAPTTVGTTPPKIVTVLLCLFIYVAIGAVVVKGRRDRG